MKGTCNEANFAIVYHSFTPCPIFMESTFCLSFISLSFATLFLGFSDKLPMLLGQQSLRDILVVLLLRTFTWLPGQLQRNPRPSSELIATSKTPFRADDKDCFWSADGEANRRSRQSRRQNLALEATQDADANFARFDWKTSRSNIVANQSGI